MLLHFQRVFWISSSDFDSSVILGFGVSNDDLVEENKPKSTVTDSFFPNSVLAKVLRSFSSSLVTTPSALQKQTAKLKSICLARCPSLAFVIS